MITVSAQDPRATKDEAEKVGRPHGTPLQKLSAEALRLLAGTYLDWRITAAFLDKYYDSVGGPGYEIYVIQRLKTLVTVMGEEAFSALAAEKDTEWVEACAAADAAARALAPCVTCGRSRCLADDLSDNPLCGKCRSEKWEREHPSVGTGADEGQPGDDDIPF